LIFYFIIIAISNVNCQSDLQKLNATYNAKDHEFYTEDPSNFSLIAYLEYSGEDLHFNNENNPIVKNVKFCYTT